MPLRFRRGPLGKQLAKADGLQELGRAHGALGDERQPCAQQHGERAGIGAVIDAARVGDGRYGGERHHNAAHPRALDAQLQHDEQEHRPHDVELLLDSERPEVRERRGIAECVEIRDILRDLPPVVEEEKRRQDIGPHLGEHHVVEDRAQNGNDDNERDRCGHKAPHAPHPEPLEVDSVGLFEFRKKQAGDEVSRKHEEDRDAQEAALRPGEVKVVEHDGDDGERADAVEGGDVARAAFRVGRKAACGRLLGARRGAACGPLLGAAHGEARLLLLTHKVTSSYIQSR